MDRLALAELAAIVGAPLAQDVAAQSAGGADATIGPDVVVDSRLATPGSLFVALPGERVDGHDFAAAAASGGAAAAIVTRPTGAPLVELRVDDALAALGELAASVVAKQRARGMATVGITGSSGKTSTKDLMAQVLEAAGATVSPPGSFNNELGVPLTACRVDSATRYLVSELGSRGLGHIAALAKIVPPDVAVVTNVGVAHLGEFGSREAIAQAKGELVEAAERWAVLNADDELVSAMRERAAAPVAAFGSHVPPQFGDIRVWAVSAKPDVAQRFSFTCVADVGGGLSSAEVGLRVAGEHQVSNALAAATAGLALGLPLGQVCAALSAAESRSKWRMQLEERSDGLLVVNDAYNANPDSMRAAIDSSIGLRRPGGRVVAVLGDMLELGPDSPRLHAQIGEYAASAGVDQLVAVGEQARHLADGFARHGGAADIAANRCEAAKLAQTRATPRDVVLVKASRGLALETVAEEIASEAR